MPRFNRTGPNGRGPFTGCGRGNCIVPYDEFEAAWHGGRDTELWKVVRELEARISELKERLDKAE